MAIVEVIEQLPGATGSWSLQTGHSLTVKLKVKTDRMTGPKAVLAAPGVAIGSTYRYPITKSPVETDPTLFAQSVSIEDSIPTSLGINWTVAIVYSRLDPAQQQGGPTDANGVRDPFSAPPRLGWRTLAEEEPVILDRDGEWILNSAGDPFDPPQMVTRSTPVAVVRTVEREFNLALLTDYKDRINKTTWLGFPAGSVLLLDVLPEREWNEDIASWVWNVEYQFAFKKSIVGTGDKVLRKGWAARLLNQGMRQLVDGKKVACVTDDGMPVGKPAQLKSDGSQAGPDDKPIYKTFDYIPEAEFNDLGLPEDLFSAGTPETP